ncbi:MAG: TMEM165/GDT1 family protein [Actinomycetota bacterium]|nr:TMEM165/GDT1 family protein [Actinomycetota bacterium]
MSLSVILTAFILIVPVELPDKTFVATLVLATRYRPLAVWVGVGLAFAVQTVVAVTLGRVVAELPRRPVTAFAAAMFLLGAIVLLRGARQADQEEAETEAEFAGKCKPGVTGLRAVTTSFVILFVAEWGDLSQLLTAGLVVRSGHPISVFVGAWAGLLLVSGIGAVAGRWLLGRVRLATVRRVGGGVCLVLAVITALQAAGVDLGV